MKGKILILLAAASLLLSGCSLFEGSYLHVTPHLEQVVGSQSEVVSASNYQQLQTVVEAMVGQGREEGVIHVANFNQKLLEAHMNDIAIHIRETYPVGAYAVENIEYEIGTKSGRPAIAVSIAYRHNRIEIQRIRTVRTMENAEIVIANALANMESPLVMEVELYEDADFAQIVSDYAEKSPDTVMEIPQVTAAIYGTGKSRVVELTFGYQTSRESLRTMQSQVRPVFDSAVLYVSGEGADTQKFSQLYGFLMERFDYALETSITPTYSLLRHGVGDSRAFAVVYGAMCRQAGLDCQIVTGTKDGNPWVWNIIQDNGAYYHVDLLRSSADGGFREFLDEDMNGYVWDYSAYPACVAPVVHQTEQVQNTERETKPSKETEPAETAPEEILPDPTDTVPTEMPEESTETTAPEEIFTPEK